MADERGAADETPPRPPGWEQCSICTPSDARMLPVHIRYAHPDVLLITTQTCSLVGPRPEPAFEVVAATQLEHYDPFCDEARGRKVQVLDLPLENGGAVRIDISRRAHLPLTSLARLNSHPSRVSTESLGAFQGWMARYYGRIALPDELDRRLKKRKFYDTVRKGLSNTLLDRNVSYKTYDDVEYIYVDWTPRGEIGHTEKYTVRFLFVCNKLKTKEALLDRLSGLATGVKGAPAMNGLLMDDPEVKLASEVLVADLKGMERVAAFDDLSAFGELRQILTIGT